MRQAPSDGTRVVEAASGDRPLFQIAVPYEAVTSEAARASVTRRSAALTWSLSKGSGARMLGPDAQPATLVNTSIPGSLTTIMRPQIRISDARNALEAGVRSPVQSWGCRLARTPDHYTCQLCIYGLVIGFWH